MTQTKKKKRKMQAEKIATGFIILVIVFAVFALLFTIKSIFFPTEAGQEASDTHESRLSLTSFDKELAREMMDKNGDGKCDYCGMDVDICIESGQMQCDMDPKSTIGILESEHIHADWKIYINNRPSDFSGMDHMTRMRGNISVSSFIHVDSDAPAPEKTGDVIHMHATGVPLWIFFDSIGMELPEGMKMYVNGKEMPDFRNYVFNDGDKILITDGNGNLEEQLNSITDYAGSH